MSVIAVKGIPIKWSLKNVVKILAKTICGHFEALNFKPGMKSKTMKICYLRLSPKLDPVSVVEKINCGQYPKAFRPFAFVPDHVPDIPLANKLVGITPKMRRALRLPEEKTPQKIITDTNDEIVAELQSKYPELYNLSEKSGHKLLEEISKIVNERLNKIAETNDEAKDSCFMMSQWYRCMHPHSGDYQLVLSTLHALQDKEGTPRTQLQEKELAALPPHPYVISKLPFEKVQQACNKYSDRIIKKISEHVNNLKSEVTETDTEDEIVRKKVREELKKMEPFLPMIVKQVFANHFAPEKNRFCRARIYGEPFLPAPETMSPFVRRYRAVRIIRSARQYNLMRLNVPPAHFASLMAMDGTVINGAKLVIRSSDMPQYKVSQKRVASACDDEPQQDDVELERIEDWSEV